MSLVAPLPALRGRVLAFDDHRGRGEVEDSEGRTAPFHCTAVADGTRTIAIGTEITFRLVTGPVGVQEAADLRPVTP